MTLLEEYKNARKKVLDLHNKVLDDVSESDVKKAANILGTLKNRQIVLESPIEKDAHMDFFLYAQIHEGKSKLNEYIKKHEDKNDEEQKLLRVMEQSETSLYEVVEINHENKMVFLKDIMNPSYVFNVIDIGMSETANKNILIFTRLLHLESFSMTSGLLFTFRREHKEYLVRKSRKLGKRIKCGNSSDKRFITFFDLNRKDGLPILLEDVE